MQPQMLSGQQQHLEDDRQYIVLQLTHSSGLVSQHTSQPVYVQATHCLSVVLRQQPAQHWSHRDRLVQPIHPNMVVLHSTHSIEVLFTAYPSRHSEHVLLSVQLMHPDIAEPHSVHVPPVRQYPTAQDLQTVDDKQTSHPRRVTEQISHVLLNKQQPYEQNVHMEDELQYWQPFMADLQSEQLVDAK